MFIHINAFNFINITSLSSVGRNKKVKKKKKKRTEACSSVQLLSPSRWKPYITSYGQKSAPQFDCYHQVSGNLTFFPKDRSLLLNSIVITKQVETSHFILRIEACSSVRLLSLSRWKPYISPYRQKPAPRFDCYHRACGNLTFFFLRT